MNTLLDAFNAFIKIGPWLVSFVFFLAGLKYANKETTLNLENLSDDVKKMEKNINDKIDSQRIAFKEDLARLEKKQDRYNNLQERTAINEQIGKSAHHRVDELHADIVSLQNRVQELTEDKNV